MKLKILFPILLAIILSPGIATAQKNNKKIIVSGYVLDPYFNPVAGAMILVDSEDTQVLTENNGYYKVRVRPDAKVISVLYQNKQVSTVLVEGQSAINFTIGEINELDKTMQQKGKSSESADSGIRKINSNDNAAPIGNLDVVELPGEENSNYQNIYQMIQSKIAGVFVDGKKIRIRGNNTFFENNDPSFVVDGMPVNSIDHILPNTVQSISILKGPAGSMYGAKGVNGVIVISLKKSTPKIN